MKNRLLLIGLVVLVFVNGVVCVILFYRYQQNRDSALGMKTLKSLYEFENIDQFSDNIEIFRSYVTPEIFTLFTADNTDRILRVYLKFNGKPSYINPIEIGSGYIIYSLVCEAIEKDRIFLFVYETKGGKVTQIREAEMISFYTTRGWEIDPYLLPFIDSPY